LLGLDTEAQGFVSLVRINW